LDYLIKQKVIGPEEKSVYTVRTDDTIAFLTEMLYETEEIDGVACSTPRAWFLWCNIVLKEEPINKKHIWNSFVENVFLDVERHRYTCLLCSRSLGKTFFVYGLYSLFKMWLFDYTNIVIAGNVPRMCKRGVRSATKLLIDTNEMLLEKKADYKGKDLIWSQDQIEFNSGILETVTVGSNIRSAHVNYVFLDDILRDDGKYASEEIDNFIWGQIFPIAQRNKARLVVTGTPISFNDAYHDIMNTKPNYAGNIIDNGDFSHRGFWCKMYRIITNWDTKEILLPELFSWWELCDEKNTQSMMATQGMKQFMREYMLICTDESTSLFSERLVKSCEDANYKFLYKGEENKYYLGGVDVATAGTASADFSAFVILEMLKTDKGIKKIIRHITHTKGMPITGEKLTDGTIVSTGQVETVENLSIKFNNALMVVEKNNVGVSLIQELIKKNVYVKEFVTDKSKKENMIRYLISEMENGNIIIPEETPEIRILKREMVNFGVVRSKRGTEQLKAMGSAKDDLIIALAIANFAAQQLTSLPFAIVQD